MEPPVLLPTHLNAKNLAESFAKDFHAFGMKYAHLHIDTFLGLLIWHLYDVVNQSTFSEVNNFEHIREKIAELEKHLKEHPEDA